MVTFHPSGPSAYDSDVSIDEILVQYDGYIITLARKLAPHNVIHPEMLDDEIDEIAQRSRIQLWHTLQHTRIISPKAYIRSIVQSEVVNVVRQHKPLNSLPIDENGELYHGHVLFAKGAPDPAFEVEQEELIADCMAKVADDVLTLPSRQQQAMICSLKELLEDILPLIRAFKRRGVNIEAVRRPEQKDEARRLMASLSMARRKLRPLRKKYNLV